VGVAALRSGKWRGDGRPVAAVVTGGNIDARVLGGCSPPAREVERDSDRWFTPAIGLVLVGAGTVLGAHLGAAPGAVAGGTVGVAGAFAVRAHSAAARRAGVPSWPCRFLPGGATSCSTTTTTTIAFRRTCAAASRTTCASSCPRRASPASRPRSPTSCGCSWPLRGHAQRRVARLRVDQVTEVLLYPHDFDRDYSFENAELAGQAHPWGTVIMSIPPAPELRRSGRRLSRRHPRVHAPGGSEPDGRAPAGSEPDEVRRCPAGCLPRGTANG